MQLRTLTLCHELRQRHPLLSATQIRSSYFLLRKYAVTIRVSVCEDGSAFRRAHRRRLLGADRTGHAKQQEASDYYSMDHSHLSFSFRAAPRINFNRAAATWFRSYPELCQDLLVAA
jgi:hypothetical protein